MVLSLFPNVYWPFVRVLWRNGCFSPLPIVELGSLFLLSFRSSVYILDVNSLLDMQFADTLSFCLLLIISFDAQKFLIFVFVAYAFWIIHVVTKSSIKIFCNVFF